MIHCVIAAGAHYEGEIVSKALRRSFSGRQVGCAIGQWPDPARVEVLAIVGPLEDCARYVREVCRRRAKIVLFGRVDAAVATLAGIRVEAVEQTLADGATCQPALPHAVSESRAFIRYADHGLGAASPLRERRLCRFDFGDEWNNLGYGRIGCDDGPWSISAAAAPCAATTVAELVDGSQRTIGAAATLHDTDTASILWFARPVGPVDGADWRVVEAFLSDYRAAELPCRPHLRDVPHGVAAAVTMRLDCDEDVASARPLLDLYRSRGHAVSVAIMTGQPEHPDHLRLLHDVKAASGSILSHSASHAPNWGGSASSAEAEARDSKAWLETRLPGLAVRYAVSPFHQNPTFVPDALARAGYDGFVAGAIGRDPEYLMARGGQVPFGPAGFVSHSQSCMLHGDCLMSEGDPIRVYKAAFGIAQAGSQFFGYLDHPFSARYSYGWASEKERLSTHAAFLDFMEQACAAGGQRLLFVNEDTCLDFMRDKAMTDLEFDARRDIVRASRTHAAGLPLSIAWRGRIEASHHA